MYKIEKIWVEGTTGQRICGRPAPAHETVVAAVDDHEIETTLSEWSDE